MANVLYAKGKEALLSAGINLLTDTIKVALIKNTYAQNITTDQYLTTVTPYVLNTAKTLGTKSVADGVFDAADPTFAAVTAGDTSEGVIIYKDTGSAATSPLIAYIDTITGFPLTTNDGDITIQWDNGSYKIFSL